MILFSFEDIDSGRKQDILGNVLPEDKMYYVSNKDCYAYNEVKERIEFFGRENFYYNHETRTWNSFEYNSYNDDEYLECTGILIK